jgi:hypothetical protein
MTGRRAHAVIALYALLALLVVPVYPHFPSPNELSRWAVAASLVERGTLEVSAVLPLLGGQFEDLAESNGRVYSNKAPGGALVGLPAYAIARAFAGPPSPQSIRPTLTAMRLLSATLPVVLLALLFAYAAARFGASDERIAIALLALLFGTPLFAYGLLNFSHALAAFALFGAWVLILLPPGEGAAERRMRGAAQPQAEFTAPLTRRFAPPSPAGRGIRDALAGALIGLAVLAEYPCAIAGVVLIAFAWRRAHRIIAGGLPFALILAIYNKAAFGTFFALSSGNERNAEFRELAAHGVFGIGLPKIDTLFRLLLDPSKGLLIFSPVLLIALAAIPRARTMLTKPAFGALVATPLALLILYSGYPNWHGGWTVGARYLVPAMPFLAMLLVFAEVRIRELVLLGVSITAVTLTTLIFPFVPGDFPLPWTTLAWPLLRHGLIAPNAMHFIARPLAIALPFALVIAACIAGVGRRAAYLAIGIVIAFAAGLFVRTSDKQLVERAYIEEVCFDRLGALPRDGRINPALLRRADAQRKLPPTPWPF